MSRIRKLGENDELSMRRFKHRTPSSKLIPTYSISKNQYSPYKEQRLAKSPSYVMMSSKKTLPRSESLLKPRTKDSKLLNRIDETSLSAARHNPWDQYLFNAKVIKEKLNKLDCSEDCHEKFVELFEEVIEKDVIFRGILMKIKEAYEGIIQKLNDDVGKIIVEVEKITQEKSNCARMLERLARENAELGKEIQRLESVCLELQKALKEIQNVDLDEVPMESEKWRGIVYENEEYCNLIYELRTELKETQFREEKLLELVGAIKRRGVDIDEIFEKDVKGESFELESMDEETLKERKMPSLELSKILRSD